MSAADRPSIQPGFCIGAFELSYAVGTVDAIGSVMSKDQKLILRQRQGYCTTCTGVPILLFDIRKSRLNPLWTTKKSRTVDGECSDGKCLRCIAERELMRRLGRRSSRAAPNSIRSIGSRTSSFNKNVSSLSFTTPLRTDSSESGSVLISSSTHGVARRDSSGRRSSNRSDSQRPFASLHATIHGSSRGQPFEMTGEPGVESNPDERRNSLPLGAQSEHVGEARPAWTPPSRSRSEQTIVTPDPMPTAETPQYKPGSRGDALNAVSRLFPSAPSVSTGNCPSLDIQVNKAIQELRPLIQDLMGAGRDSANILVDILSSSLESFPCDERYQLFCLEAISNCLEATGACNASLMSFHRYESVLKAMQRFPSLKKVQEYGCVVIFMIAANPSNRVTLARDSTCSCLLEAMAAFSSNIALARNAIGALRNISLDPEAHQSLVRLPTCERTVQVMQTNFQDNVVQRDGCALLSNLAVDTEKQTVSSVSFEVMQAVSRAIETHCSDAAVVDSACFALKNFAFEASNLRSMRRVERIFDVLKSAEEFAVNGEDAAIISEKLHTSRAEDESLEEQTHETLLAILEVQSDSPADAVATVMCVLEEYGWSTKITVICMQIMQKQAAESGKQRRNLLEAGALEHAFRAVEAIGIACLEGDPS